MNIWRYAGQRIFMLIPQLLGISLVTFMLVRLLPGAPAVVILGPLATPEAIEKQRERMGLNDPITTQYVVYLGRVIQGDLGKSFFTGLPVLDDIRDRAPITFELITLALIVAFVVGVPLGLISSIRPKGLISRLARAYGMLAGAFPDFWLGLLLIYVFFFLLSWAPAPVGRLPFGVSGPTRVTGMLLVDSLVTLNWEAFWAVLKQMALPLLTLAIIYTSPVVKMTSLTLTELLESGFIRHARNSGLQEDLVMRYALHNTLPPVITVMGLLWVFLLGGAVLIEQVYAWGGLGQYAVAAIVNADYAAVQGFVLVAATFTLLVNLAVDLLYLAVDPRISY